MPLVDESGCLKASSRDGDSGSWVLNCKDASLGTLLFAGHQIGVVFVDTKERIGCEITLL